MHENEVIFRKASPQPRMQEDYYSEKKSPKPNPIEQKINELLSIQPPTPMVICKITEKNGTTHTGSIQAKTATTITIINRFQEQIIPIDVIEQIQPVSFQQ